MKIKLLAGIALAAMLISGCTTVQTVTTAPDGTTKTNTVSKLDPQRTAQAIRAIIPPAVRLAVAKEPAARQIIDKARLAICATATAGNLSPTDLRAAIDATGIRELQTPEVQAAIEATFGLYQAYYGDVVTAKLDQSKWLIPVCQAICDSLQAGLSSLPPVPTVPPAGAPSSAMTPLPAMFLIPQ